ncbi:glycoside hydrolase family 2 TIM barrel-domain containing protein [Microbacterium sp.]|uniref:glycoside hydrolase family 2 protein n=1 Tax=Microbacterium sp. TaxID=51671 RepID=UPI00289E2D02|nr:glycoside hydrolase family 2 TIM barrel-domain containing protein [Microbacterium sp.]
MTTTPFSRGWEFRRERESAYVPVDLPHDAMIGEVRTADARSWAHGAYFPGGEYRYRKVWTPTEEFTGREVSLRFEGVYRHSRILLDGRVVGGSPSGYREFEVRLDPHLVIASEHVIEVEVDNVATPNSRWYTGSGIYRPVWLESRDRVHVLPGGIAVRTRSVGSAAVVEVDVTIANPGVADVKLDVILSRNGDVVASRSARTSGIAASVDLHVPDPELWSADSPSLHDLRVDLSSDGVRRDEVHRRIGLRTVEVVPGVGLRINGRAEILRGANVHSDNGILGAAVFPEAERRRIRILREAGFNAIRSAHNPASRAMLDACDEFGMYVMDEAFDGWYDHKTEHDDAEAFDGIWREELASLVAKDRTHASVVMYSIGNENGEAFSPRGRCTAAAMASELRRLDPTRLSTIGVNLVAASFAGVADGYEKDSSAASAGAPDMTSTALNVISNRFGFLMTRFPRLKGADRSTRELFSHVDVAGYNYGTSRYEIDAVVHPARLIVGTESMPGDLARNHALAEKLPGLIGDFVWAGWDYMGEAGGGAWSYGVRSAPFLKEYPQLTSQMGIFDITGEPGAAINLGKAAWGMLAAPAIAVRPLDVRSGPAARSAWRSSDAIESWSWTGHEGERSEIEVYSADDEVELLVNGRTLGRKKSGAGTGFIARFPVRYEPGTLEAIAYRAGLPVARSELRSAGPSGLRVTLDRASDVSVDDVTYVRIELADDAGVVDSSATDIVVVRVEGPATVAGLGSGAPATTESFTDLVHSTYRGRALLALRGTGASGTVVLDVSTRTHGSAQLSVESSGETIGARAGAPLKGRHV